MAAAVDRAIKSTLAVSSTTKRFLYSSSQPPRFFTRRPLLLLYHALRLLSPASPSSSRFTPIRCCVTHSGDASSPLNRGSNFNYGRPPTKMAPMFPLCDYIHWLILMDTPGGETATKQQMIDCYVQTLAKVVGSEEEAMKKIYKVSCAGHLGFGCTIDMTTAMKLKGLSGVLVVVPDRYGNPPCEYVDPPGSNVHFPYNIYAESKYKDYQGNDKAMRVGVERVKKAVESLSSVHRDVISKAIRRIEAVEKWIAAHNLIYGKAGAIASTINLVEVHIQFLRGQSKGDLENVISKNLEQVLHDLTSKGAGLPLKNLSTQEAGSLPPPHQNGCFRMDDPPSSVFMDKDFGGF